MARFGSSQVQVPQLSLPSNYKFYQPTKHSSFTKMKNLNATLVVAITAASSFASTSNAFLPVHTAVVEPAVVKAGRRRRCIDTNICPHHHAVQGGGVDDNSRFTTSSSSSTPSLSIIIQKAKLFASKQFFPLGMVVAVTFAKRFPWLGKNGSILHPELFIGQYGVATIFLLSGLSLRLSELSDAISNVSLNMAIQFATFAVWPFCIGLPLTKVLGTFNVLPPPLIDGLLILTCLPTTINMCVVLTSTSGGNVACSLCNAVTSNVAGIFITPALLILFLGKREINLPFLDMVNKLCGKVLLPVAVGQALRATPIKDLYEKWSKFFKRFQEIVLLGIVWNAFCNAFSKGLGLDLTHAIALLILLPLLHLGALFAFFSIFRYSGGVNKTSTTTTTTMKAGRDAVAATFCASHKTLAFGLPLINTIFSGSSNLASYCAPIMLVHPIQLLIGSFVVPYFKQFTGVSEER